MAERTRSRPLLGTRVTIRAGGTAEAAVDRAIDAAFAELERAQRLMSFHDPASELSRLNREAALRPTQVHPLTFGVLRRALWMARESGGRFDPVVGRELVERGVLPTPLAVAGGRGDPVRGSSSDGRADWRDVLLLEERRVQFRRPLWIDLGGIAKGWAVDRAVAALRRCGATSGCVNAGGDLRVFGPEAEQVLLRPAIDDGRDLPLMLLERAALASSAGPASAAQEPASGAGSHGAVSDETRLATHRTIPELALTAGNNGSDDSGAGARDLTSAAPGSTLPRDADRNTRDADRSGLVLDGRTRRSARIGRSVSVVARNAWLADALTKVLMAAPHESERILRRHGAMGWVHSPEEGWRACPS